MNGIELFRSLRSEYPDLPVIGLSGYVDSDKVSGLGFDGFLHKPLSLALLKNQIESHITRFVRSPMSSSRLAKCTAYDLEVGLPPSKSNGQRGLTTVVIMCTIYTHTIGVL
jgi:DNA-binding response OmpR family regulator